MQTFLEPASLVCVVSDVQSRVGLFEKAIDALGSDTVCIVYDPKDVDKCEQFPAQYTRIAVGDLAGTLPKNASKTTYLFPWMSNAIVQSRAVRNMLFNGRHAGISRILGCNQLGEIPSALRAQIDVFFCKEAPDHRLELDMSTDAMIAQEFANAQEQGKLLAIKSYPTLMIAAV